MTNIFNRSNRDSSVRLSARNPFVSYLIREDGGINNLIKSSEDESLASGSSSNSSQPSWAENLQVLPDSRR